MKLTIAIYGGFVQTTIDDIVGAACTGLNDGKTFVQPLERVIRIRTGEDGGALTPVGA